MPSTSELPTAVVIVTISENIVWRTVRSTRAVTACSPWRRKRSHSWRSRPKATITRIITIASCTIVSDMLSWWRTSTTRGWMRLA